MLEGGGEAHGWVAHVGFSADEVGDGDLYFLEEVSAVVLEDGNVEHHDSLDAVIARQYFIIE